MAGQWEYDATSRRYRGPDGRFVSMNTVRRMRDGIATRQAATLGDLAVKALAGDITSPAFVHAMRAEVKRITVLQYMLGRGGRNAMTAQDRGRLGGILKAQYRYINGFAEALANGEVTEAQAKARAALYSGASTGAFERGHAASFNIRLPVYPGETACMGNCKCRWRIEEFTDRIEATWLLEPSAQHCGDCVSNSAEYAPFTIEKDTKDTTP